jgi:GTP pyrophosphokinase
MSKENMPNNQRLEDLLKKVKEYLPNADTDLVRLAYDFAAEAHQGQKRLTGEDYVTHPLETAIILASMQADLPTIIAGLLHDVPEDTAFTLEDIKKNFGEEVAQLVSGIVKLGKIKYRGIERYIENLRKMCVAMAEDIRVIFIKLADRLHNLRTLGVHSREKQIRIAKESIEIFAAIANRLGMGQMKGEIEDEAFRHLFPKEYEEVKRYLEEDLEKKKEILKKAPAFIKEKLESQGINVVRIDKRQKRLFSLYQKLQEHEGDIQKIYDMVAVRIIVNTIPDCYGTLGIIHQYFKPLKGRIKDYVANPKPNGYQALHTTVFCERTVVEFQIRTVAMDREAEYGISAQARWHYNERGNKTAKIDRRLAWVKDLPKLASIKDHELYLQSLKIDTLHNRIFVFTPKGDVIDLPEKSTPIDFAYHLHTQIGNSCVGAKVNDVLVPLSAELMSGDMVEITTDKNRQAPSTDWLKFAKTSTARIKIKTALKQHSVVRRLTSFLSKK